MAWQLIHYGTKFALLFYTLFHFILYLFYTYFFFNLLALCQLYKRGSKICHPQYPFLCIGISKFIKFVPWLKVY